jgi:hypothetical protein
MHESLANLHRDVLVTSRAFCFFSIGTKDYVDYFKMYWAFGKRSYDSIKTHYSGGNSKLASQCGPVVHHFVMLLA